MNQFVLTPVVERADEGGYVAYVAELPGANTQGETVEEALTNLCDATSLLIECMETFPTKK